VRRKQEGRQDRKIRGGRRERRKRRMSYSDLPIPLVHRCRLAVLTFQRLI